MSVGVTDEGIRALARSGCGQHLTLLDLRGELLIVVVLFEETRENQWNVVFSFSLFFFLDYSAPMASDGRSAVCTGLFRLWQEIDVAVSLLCVCSGSNWNGHVGRSRCGMSVFFLLHEQQCKRE